MQDELHAKCLSFQKQYTLFPKSEKELLDNYHGWRQRIYARWNKRHIRFTFDLSHEELPMKLSKYRIRRSGGFLSYILRQDQYFSRGKETSFVYMLLQSDNLVYLLDYTRSVFELNEKGFEFKAKVRWKDEVALSNLFTVLEYMMDEIEDIIDMTLHPEKYQDGP